MKRRLIAGLLAAMMVISLAACGSKGGSDTKDTKPAGTAGGETAGTSGNEETGSKYQTTYGSKQFDNVTIQVELFDRSSAPAGSTILDNKWTKYCQEAMAKVGINLEFVAVPRGDEVAKMQTMMGSGTAPTIVLTYTYSYARDYYNDGGIWDLSEFVDGEDQAQNLKAYIGENCLELARNSADGALMGIIARRATVANSNLFIRQDWLDKLGIDVPTTTDELKDALHEMVYNNPEGNTGVIGILLPSMTDNYITNQRDAESLTFYENVKDEKAMAVNDGFDYYSDPGYREYLRWVNELYNDGLMDKEFFASTDEILQSNFVNGKLAAYDANVGHNVDILRGGLLQSLKTKNPEGEMIAINAMHSNVYPDEVFVPAYGDGGLICMVPKTYNEDQVEAAVTYLDWLSTEEGGFAIYHGFEGEHFEYNEDGAPVPKDADYNKKDKDWIRTDLFLVGNQGYFSNIDDFNTCIAADNPGWEEYTISDYEKSLEGTLVQSAQYMYSPEIQLEKQTDLNLLMGEWKVKCITCAPADFDSNYDQWLAAAKAAGVEDILAAREEIYNEVKGE